MCGGVVAILVGLALYDEDVLQVEHVVTIVALLTFVIVIFQ